MDASSALALIDLAGGLASKGGRALSDAFTSNSTKLDTTLVSSLMVVGTHRLTQTWLETRTADEHNFECGAEITYRSGILRKSSVSVRCYARSW